jgi:hypothetical protein
MSKFEEMCEAATTAHKHFTEYSARCRQYMFSLVDGLVKYCQIPTTHITFMRWNKCEGELSQYLEAEEGKKWALVSAVEFDNVGTWCHLGVCITLNPSNPKSSRWVSFALCMSEQEGKPTVKIGDFGKQYQVDLKDARQCDQFYEEIVKMVKQCFDTHNRDSKAIGFNVGS